MRGLSLVAASGGHSSSRCAGLSLSRPLLLRSTSSRRAGSVVVAHGPSCSAACGIFPDQGSNPCPLHWQADSQPLHHQGSPFQSVLCLFLNSLQAIHPLWTLRRPLPLPRPWEMFPRGSLGDGGVGGAENSEEETLWAGPAGWPASVQVGIGAERPSRCPVHTEEGGRMEPGVLGDPE